MSYDEILMMELGRAVMRKLRCPRRTSMLPECVVVTGLGCGRVVIDVFVPVLMMLEVPERMDMASGASMRGEA